jgi:hypothetical protein
MDWSDGMVAVCFDSRTIVTVNAFDLAEIGLHLASSS